MRISFPSLSVGWSAFVLAMAILGGSRAATAMAQTVDEARVREYVKIGDSLGGFTGDLENVDVFSAVAKLGDVDGDGIPDLAVGAPGDDDGGVDRGAVWILFLRADGTVREHQKISDTSGGFQGALDNGDRLGASIATLGDLDGDCVPELAVGAAFDDDGGGAGFFGGVGAIWILFLRSDGTVKSHQKISATQGGFTGTLEELDCFGCSLAALGDLDGDGVTDLVAGALRDDDGGIDRGAVWILFLNADGTVKAHQKISATRGGFGPLADDSLFGATCAGLDDLDGDGVPEIAVGMVDVVPFYGAVWILFLDRSGMVRAQQKIGQGSGGFTGTLDREDLFVITASLGDLDGDGIGDLAVGTLYDDDGGTDRGAVWILTLLANGRVKTNQKISDLRGGFRGELADEDKFGGVVASIGDLDGDGISELAVGATGDDGNGTDRGAVWILFLGESKDRESPGAPLSAGTRVASVGVAGTSARLLLVPKERVVSPDAIPVLVLVPGGNPGFPVGRIRLGALPRGLRTTLYGPPLTGGFATFELPLDPRLVGVTFACRGFFLDAGFGVRPRATPARVMIDCPGGKPLTHITLGDVDVR